MPEEQKAPQLVAQPPKEWDVTFNGGVTEVVLEEEMTKGRNAGKIKYGFKNTSILETAVVIIGAENYTRWFRKEMNRALNDAASDCADAEDGKVSDSGLAKAFVEQFTAATRAHLEAKAKLEEKARELYARMSPQIMRQLRGETLTQEEHNELLTIGEQWQTLEAEILKRRRVGRKPKQEVPAVAA